MGQQLPDNRVTSPTKKKWGVITTISIGILGYMLSNVLAVVVALYGKEYIGNDFADNIYLNFGILVVGDLAILCTIYTFLRMQGYNFQDLGVQVTNQFTNWFLIIPSGFGYLLTTIGISAVVSVLIPEVDLEQTQDLVFTGASSNIEMVFAAIALLVIAPISEELIFRGFIFRGFRKYGFVMAALVSSILFGLAHGQVNVAIDTFALGLFLSYLYERTGSIWPSIALHSLKNGVAFYILFFTEFAVL